MTRILMTIMAVAMAVTFSAPSFAGEAIKGGPVLVYGEEQKEKKTPSSPFSLARPAQKETH